MGQTLLIEANETLGMLYSLNLHMYVGTDVVVKKDYKEAIELLKYHDGVDLIICRAVVGPKEEEVKEGLEIYKFLKGHDRHIPMIVISDDTLLDKHCVTLPKNMSIKDLISTSAKCLGVTPRQMAQRSFPDYYPIPIIYYSNVDQTVCDTFIKFQTGDGPQFTKRFSQGHYLKLKELEDLIKQGITTLYVLKEERLNFVKNVTQGIMGKLNSGELSDSERVEVTSQSVEVVRTQLQTAGLSPETIELAKASMDSVKKIVRASPTLKALLERLNSDVSTFHYRHVQLITYISFHVLSNLEWGTDEQRDKLAFVSYFHDITLPTDAMVKVQNEDDLRSSKLTDKERLRVQTHALEAAKLVAEFPRTPFGVEQIIKQHHGSMSGTGLAKNFSNNISPLAIVFIVSEDFAHMILNTKNHSMDHEKIMTQLYEKYPRSMYQKVIKTLENLKAFG